MKLKYLLPVLLIFAVSCTKDETITTMNQPVIQCYLIPGKISSLVISQLSQVYETETIDLDTLELIFKVNSNVFTLTSKGNGKYIGDSSSIVHVGDTCSLEFKWLNSLVKASTIIPEKPEGFQASASAIAIEAFNPESGTTSYIPDPIKLTWRNPGNEFHLVVVKNIEYYPASINSHGGGPKGFQNRPSLDTTSELGFRDFSYYGTHRIILFRLNPESVSLYDFQGSSSQDISSQPANIKNGLGVFTGINSDTLLVEVTRH